MSVLSFDTETGGLDWFEPDQQAFMLQWDSPEENRIGITGDAAAWNLGSPDYRFNYEVREAFTRAVDRADVLAAHNLPFDVHQVRATLDIDLLNSGKKLVDTAVLARVVLPERRQRWGEEQEDDTTGFKLKSLGVTYVDKDAADSEDALKELAKKHGINLKEKGGYLALYEVEPEAMELYGRKDTRLVTELLPALEAKIGDRFKRVWELENRVQPILIRAEQRGVAVDQAVVQPLKAEYEGLRDRSMSELEDTLGPAEVLNSPDQLKQSLLSLGVPLKRLTPAGRKLEQAGELAAADRVNYLATDKFALMEHEDTFPVLKTLAEYRKASKFLSSFLYPMDGRAVVHPSYHQVGPWTGRMSCSRPNMQQMPTRDELSDTSVRAVFVPRPGYCFVVCDYDSIEIKLLAYYLNVPWFIEALENGLDPHSWMASQIWGGVPEDYAKGGPNDKLRALAKNILFAIVYGAGAPRVMDMLAAAGMPSTRDHARNLIRAIKRALPGYHRLNSRIRKQVEAIQHVNTIMGRKQPVMRDRAYVGMNAIIQGGGADAFKQGVINTVEATGHLGAEPVLFVHDELGLEVPTEHAQEVLALQSLAMSEALDIHPTLVVTGSVAMTNYAEAK